MTPFRRGAASLLLALAFAGCRATTNRPPFVPFPEASHGEIGFGIADKVVTVRRATVALVDALRVDSIPVSKVYEFDGYAETGWFDAASLAPADGRPLGPDVVKVRAWVNPAKPGFSEIEVETVYVPFADPSRPGRDLEAPVPTDHPVAKRIEAVVKSLVERFGEPEEETPIRQAPRGPPVADSAQVGPPAPPVPQPAPAPPPAPSPPPPPPPDTTMVSG